jgi:CRP-like cAMP-binding protein
MKRFLPILTKSEHLEETLIVPMPETVIPKISQETLAEMVGTTRSRVNLFLNKFRNSGFVDYGGSGAASS